MSGKCLWNLTWGPDMSGSRLSHCGIGLGRTCSGWGSDMPRQSQWNSATEPDKAERSDMSGLGVGHVRGESL
jgi:hypothetical protein